MPNAEYYKPGDRGGGTSPDNMQYEFLRTLHDLRGEMQESREELKRLRRGLEKHVEALDENSDLMQKLGTVLGAALDKVNIAKGIGTVIGRLVNRRGDGR